MGVFVCMHGRTGKHVSIRWEDLHVHVFVHILAVCVVGTWLCKCVRMCEHTSQPERSLRMDFME